MSKFSAPGQMEVVCMCLDEVCTLLSCDTTAVVKMAFEIMIDYWTILFMEGLSLSHNLTVSNIAILGDNICNSRGNYVCGH